MLSSTIKSSRIYVYNYTFRALIRVHVYLLMCTHVNMQAEPVHTASAETHSCMYSRIRERVRDICLSSIHTRLLITYSLVSVPRRIARRYTYMYGVSRAHRYFIIDGMHSLVHVPKVQLRVQELCIEEWARALGYALLCIARCAISRCACVTRKTWWIKFESANIAFLSFFFVLPQHWANVCRNARVFISRDTEPSSCDRERLKCVETVTIRSLGARLFAENIVRTV